MTEIAQIFFDSHTAWLQEQREKSNDRETELICFEPAEIIRKEIVMRIQQTKNKEFVIFNFREDELDNRRFYIRTNCGYTINEIKNILSKNGYDVSSYNIRTTYIRFIWETITYDNNEWNDVRGYYREFENGGRGATKVYMFSVKPKEGE